MSDPNSQRLYHLIQSLIYEVVDKALKKYNPDLTRAHGAIVSKQIANGAVLGPKVPNGALSAAKLDFDPATQAELDAHASDTTSVHGITDTSLLITSDGNARVAVRKNSTGSTISTRRRLNLIEGTNITISVSDDSTNEEVDVTLAANDANTITFEELDGNPTIDTPTKIIFPNGTLSIAGTELTYTPLVRGHVYNEVPSGTINGSNDAFTLAEQGLADTLRLYIKPSGDLGYVRLDATDYTENSGYSIVTSGMTPNVDLGTPVTGFGSSGNPASLTDNNNSTGLGFNEYGADIDAPIAVSFDFTTPIAIRRTIVVGQTSGGWSPPRNIKIQYSDDNSSWLDALTATGSNSTEASSNTYDNTDQGLHQYWRLYVRDNFVNSGSTFTAMRELKMYTFADLTGFTMVTAPSTGDSLLVDYDTTI